MSRYLFDRQGEGLDLQLPEHRGELRARVEPLLNKMPRSTLRDAMWHEMLRLCGGRNQWQNRQPQQRSKWRNGEYRDRPTEERVDVKLNKDSTLCLALVEAPELATEVSELARQSRQFPQAMGLATWIMEKGIRDRRKLIVALALDQQARDRFYHLFDGIEHIPSRESTLASARELISPSEETSRQQRLATLLRNFANLSAEERNELRELSGGTQG